MFDDDGFDNEMRWFMNDHTINKMQQQAIQTLALNSEVDGANYQRTQRKIDQMSQHNATLESRVARLELVCEGLLNILKEQGTISDAMIDIAVARVDLADGLEDGQKGSVEALRSCRCPSCKRPANPRREICVFCFEPLPAELRAQAALARPKPAAAKKISCASCGEKVFKDMTYFSEVGEVCGTCHSR